MHNGRKTIIKYIASARDRTGRLTTRYINGKPIHERKLEVFQYLLSLATLRQRDARSPRLERSLTIIVILQKSTLAMYPASRLTKNVSRMRDISVQHVYVRARASSTPRTGMPRAKAPRERGSTIANGDHKLVTSNVQCVHRAPCNKFAITKIIYICCSMISLCT